MANTIAILFFALIIGYLFVLLAKNWVPFNFSALAGNAPPVPRPATFNNQVASETGAKISRTLFAKGIAIVFAIAFINTMVVLVGDMRVKGDWDPNQTGPNFPPGVVAR